MPCWEVNIVSVEFKVKNKEILLLALKNMGLSPTESPIGVIRVRGIVLDLNRGEAELRSGVGDQNFLNSMKQEYSKTVIALVAKKKKWALKKKKDSNKFLLRRG